MLAELAAANAAFAVIKKTLQNGREIADCGKAISQFVTAKDDLQKKGTKKKNSFWRRVGGKSGDDLEEFMALEKIRQQEEQLKEVMIYCGRPGLWNDWVRFQADARVRRQNEAKEAARAREKLWETIGLIVLAILAGGTALFVIAILYMAWRA